MLREALVGGCWLVVSAAVVIAADPPVLNAREIQVARKLYIAKCVKCHEEYSPKRYSEADWAKWMTRMGRKSKLDPVQTDLLRQYTAMLREEPAKK
jgi:cytochrome c5